MTATYLEQKQRRDAMARRKDESVFGLVSGLLLLSAGAIRWLSAADAWDIASLCLAGLGLAFFLLGMAAPSLLRWPYRGFRFFGNLMGKAVFAVVLTALYLLLVLPVGLLSRRKRLAQGYVTWDKTPPKAQSMFADWNPTGSGGKDGGSSYFGILYRLLALFIANRKIILIPVLVVLVLVGLILFFVSSNVVTAFVYTLF